MTIQERHMLMVDSVNNARTQRQHEDYRIALHAWRLGVCHDDPVRYGNMLIDADLVQMGRGIDRPMCGGVFLDWKEDA